jgi:hypothetical protein
MKELARFLPACVTMIRRLRKDPRVPPSAKIAVLLEAWPGDPKLLERLLGSAREEIARGAAPV